MPQDSSFISHSTEGSSAGRMSECSSKKQAIVPDMGGNFFVMKQTIDVPKYHKWLVTEQPKETNDTEKLDAPLPFIVDGTTFLSKDDVEEMNTRRKQLNSSSKKADKSLTETFFGLMTCSTHVKVHTR